MFIQADGVKLTARGAQVRHPPESGGVVSNCCSPLSARDMEILGAD